jgi:hypothetical protein
MSNGNGSICPTLVENPWGEAQCFQDGKNLVYTQITWWREPMLPSKLAEWIVKECGLDKYEKLTLSIHSALHFEVNGWADGVSEYGFKAEWEVSFKQPKSWGVDTEPEPMQLCEACHLEINPGDSFVKESTQSAQNGRPIEVDVRIYHEGCVV